MARRPAPVIVSGAALSTFRSPLVLSSAPERGIDSKYRPEPSTIVFEPRLPRPQSFRVPSDSTASRSEHLPSCATNSSLVGRDPQGGCGGSHGTHERHAHGDANSQRSDRAHAHQIPGRPQGDHARELRRSARQRRRAQALGKRPRRCHQPRSEPDRRPHPRAPTASPHRRSHAPRNRTRAPAQHHRSPPALLGTQAAVRSPNPTRAPRQTPTPATPSIAV